MKHPVKRFCIVTLLAGSALTFGSAMAQGDNSLDAEMSGVESAAAGSPASAIPHGPGIPPGGLLLVPESTNDRVMAFDPISGDLVNADYIPADPDNLSTPISVVLKFDGNGFLVSDQIDDVVQEYSLTGAYVGVFAPAGGVNTAILDNIRGIAYRPNGNLLVTVGGGTNSNAIAEFDGAGAYLGNFIANGAGGLDSPFDVLLRTNDYLVSGITSDQIHSYNLAGAANPALTAINTFPEQLAVAANGNILVANFSGTEEGVVEYTAAGALVGIYDPAALGGYRGVYELPGGNILTTNGSGVHEIDRAGNLVETKISGVSARFITFVQGGLAIVANDDDFTATPVSSTTGGIAGNVLANDTLDGSPATTATVTLGQISSSDPGVNLDASTGNVTVAAGAGLGTQTLDYQICESASPSNCDSAVASLTVAAGVAVDQIELPAGGRWSAILLVLLIVALTAHRMRKRNSSAS